MAAKYYVEMGKTPRVFVTPPVSPKGPVIEVTKAQWEALEKSPRDTWSLKTGRISTPTHTVIKGRAFLTSLVPALLGAMVGAGAAYLLINL